MNYSWSPAKGLASTTGANVIATVNVNTSFTVISTNGCGSIAKSITVTVKPNPTASISGNLTICNGHSTTLTASAMGGGASYLWQPGAIPTQTVNLNTSQTYTVIATGANNCTDTATVFLRNVTPVIAISGNTTICNGENVSLTASGASAYNWSTAASTAAITTHPIITTTYSVTGTSNDCSATASKTITVFDCTGIEDFDVSNGINIYPNPNSGKFIISKDDISLLSKPEIIIYDLLGNTVSSLKLSSAQIEIDLSVQPKGIYSIKIFDRNGYVGVWKIIVQ